MKKRPTTAEERRLFEKAVLAARLVPAAASKPTARKSAARGMREPQARLDLHGMTEAGAHAALLSFLRGARQRGLILVLVITGRGISSLPDASYEMGLERSGRGILKKAVPRWFKEKEFVALVRGSVPAPRRHGGEGALYVSLARPR